MQPVFKAASRMMVAIVMAGTVLGTTTPAFSQSQALEITVHAAALESNRLGDPADQKVGLYLPAAYFKEPNRQFATVYFLHGFADTPAKGVAEILKRHMDGLIAAHKVEPMIVVAPNGLNRFSGSFYTNSAVTGDWESYVTRDVVGYIDAHYRSIPEAKARGISGHSMGGYGALMLAFRHPDVFGSVYAMSPAMTVLEGDLGPSNPVWSRLATVKTPADLAGLLDHDFFLAVVIGMDAAFAPEPEKAPTFGLPPFKMEGEQAVPDPAVLAKFQAKIVSTAIPSMIATISQLKGIYIDYGAEDPFTHIPLGARRVSEELSLLGIPNTLEVYEGTHDNQVNRRLDERVLPWLSERLQH